MMLLPGIQWMAQDLTLKLADCLFEGTVVALVAALISRLWLGQSSSARFMLWFVALLGIAASPLLSTLRSSPGISPTVSRVPITLPVSWALYFSIAWAVISGFLLLRVVIGVVRLRSLRKTFVPVEVEHLDSSTRQLLQRDGKEREILLCSSDRIQVPAAIGLSDPIVVLPKWALEEMSADELKQILLHELAHLRRRDDWTNLAQRIVKALFFFHPAVWWIERRISLEREMACDDAVLAETNQPRAYAKCLTHMAEKTLTRRGLELAQAALGRVRQTSQRVAQILKGKQQSRNAQPWKIGCSTAVFVIVCALVGIKEPRFIAFENSGPSASQPVVANTKFLEAGFSTARSANDGLQNADPQNTHVSSAHQLNSRLSNNGFMRPAAFKIPDTKQQGSGVQPIAPMVRRNTIASNRSHSMARAITDRPTWAKIRTTSGFLHFAARISEPGMTNAVFLVFQERDAGFSIQPVLYEIQVWHFTVTPVLPAKSTLLRKET